MRKYQFVVGVSLAALEEEVNRLVSEEPGLRLIQVLQVMGSGLVAVVEHADRIAEPAQDAREAPAEGKRAGPAVGSRKMKAAKTHGG
jgi:hypothetical protein